MSARTTVGHSCFETREARRRAAQRLQETLQAINPDELAPVDGSLQAVLDEIRSELALREEKHPRRKERLSGLPRLQMKQLCAVLTGMQVSHNYEQGQQLLQSREFSSRKAFFQTVLEIGRRYKILNPERMRDSYGKLMYFLQDSRKPEVRDLLEFDIVSPVRSVWDVLKRSPKGCELLEDGATFGCRAQVQREIKNKEATIKHLSSKYCSVQRRRKRHYGGIYSTWNLLRSYRDSDSEDVADGDELSEETRSERAGPPPASGVSHLARCCRILRPLDFSAMAFRPARVRVPHLGLLALRAPRTPSAADLLRAGTVRRWLSSEKRELDPNGPSDALTSFTGGLPTQRSTDFELRQSFRKFPLHRQGFFPKSRRPRAIIVQPTRELALQTIKVVRNFPVRSAVLAPSCSFIKESQALHQGVDVVVATPFRLILHLAKAHLELNDARHVVLDEADTLCDTFYQKEASKLLQGLQKDCRVKPQIVVVGATRTGAVSAFLRQHLNQTEVMPVVTTDAHVPPPNLEQVFVPTKGRRLLTVLWEVLGEVATVNRKTLIFTNRLPSCRMVFKSLQEHGVNAVALHGNVHPKKRKEAYEAFNSASGAEVMVCTNLASRGLDFSVSAKVKKIMAIENFQKVLQRDVNKSVKQKLKKRLGLPPARNIGSKETKAAMKRLDRRMRAIKHMRFLWKRGILKKGHGIPKMPDAQVEVSETQTVSTMVRARDGLLQVLPRRRKLDRQADTAGGAPIDRTLRDFFDPEDPGPDPAYSLAIEEGVNGARLSHPHSRQYTFVLQSMTLWREVLDNMFQLWHMAEEDLLDDEQQYQLADTGQGYQRVQKSTRSVVAMQKILADVQRKVGGWVGSSIVHLGDHNVPNALMFIDKYIQVPRFLGPLVLTLDKIPELSRSTSGMQVYIESFGGVKRLQKLILADFFKHAFDGSGADNFFDAGSCIDGRLTSAWNWCSSIESKPCAELGRTSASCPDTEPRPDASSSPVPASGALSLLGKQLPPVPSSTLRTSLDTEVPMEQRLQDPVTYSFAEDGNILLTNVMAGLPCLPKKLAQPLRSIQVGEIVELCLKFDVSKLTPPAFARIVEVYAIAKAKHLAQEIWEAKHLPKGARSMEKLTTLPEVEDKLPYMCASCFTSWILPAAKKCLHCASTEGKVPTALPSASVTVDGVTWTMTFDADKQLRWQSDAPDLGDTQKPLCSVEVSSLGQKPPTAGATPREVTFSELVSDSSRMTLRQEVLKRGDDEVFHKEVAKKPQGVMDHDPGQETVTFHPTNVKAMRLVSELRQAERREKKEARVEEENQAYHRKQKRKLELLLPTYDAISVWPEKVRKALESGLFEPERGPMAVDGDQLQDVKEAYLRTRELIKQGTNPYQPRLLEEIPDCPLNTHAFLD
eukprot:g32468.t1